METMTLGSLFDGAGTFPFAAQICGIETLWSSEIEPFPLAVTAKRFPNVKQLGDVTKINGAEIDPVDIITFGSPCQDLSVAGQRKGLDGERSGLFMEAIRIIKEMRKKTNGVYPRFAVWENVPGAFSSNKGEDFRTVLEAICKVKDRSAVIPRPTNRGGRWSDAGEILADEYSVAWRVLDAQFWGVPQRRRRIFLVADFRGQRAGEILFEREGLYRDFAENRETWKGITKSLAYRTDAGCVFSVEDHPADSRVNIRSDGLTNTLSAQMGTGGGNCPLVLSVHSGGLSTNISENICNTLLSTTFKQKDFICAAFKHNQWSKAMGIGYEEDTSPTLSTGQSCAVFAIQGNCIDRADTAGCNGKGCREDQMYTLNTVDRHAVAYGVDCRNGSLYKNVNGTLQAKDGGYNYNSNNTILHCYAIDRAAFNQGQNAQYQPKIDDSGIMHTIVARCPNAVGICERIRFILRRITPTECARLQGMPDWWCDDVPHSDSAEYKMWGNGIALPCALYVMEGLKGCGTNEKL